MTSSPSAVTRSSAEVLGTSWLVVGGCGSAVLGASFSDVGIGLHGVEAAFGLTVLTMACASGRAGFQLSAGLACNGYGANSPGEDAIHACLLAEVVFAFMFVVVVLGATSPNAPEGLAPIAIGLALTTVPLIGIPVINLSVNPAHSAAAVQVGGWALYQLWMFWLAPPTGAVLAGIAIRLFPALQYPSRGCLPPKQHPLEIKKE